MERIMAYISADEVRAIRVALKEKFGSRGFKFGVRNSNQMEVIVTVLCGPTDFSDILKGKECFQINNYYLDDYRQHETFFKEIETIIKTAPATVNGGWVWYNNSDVQSDYFDRAYYYSMRIGAWDKPYVQNDVKKIPA